MELLFAGVVVSVTVQVLKIIFGTSRLATMVILVVLSIVAGISYVILTRYGLFEVFWNVLVYAGAFYAFVIKNVASTLPDTPKFEPDLD